LCLFSKPFIVSAGFLYTIENIFRGIKIYHMKKQIFTLLAIISLGLASCSGNKADGSDSNQDSTVRPGDTSGYHTDTTSKDSASSKGLADSTTNAPKMPGK
jgi:hypothetical protein